MITKVRISDSSRRRLALSETDSCVNLTENAQPAKVEPKAPEVALGEVRHPEREEPYRTVAAVHPLRRALV